MVVVCVCVFVPTVSGGCIGVHKFYVVVNEMHLCRDFVCVYTAYSIHSQYFSFVSGNVCTLTHISCILMKILCECSGGVSDPRSFKKIIFILCCQ